MKTQQKSYCLLFQSCGMHMQVMNWEHMILLECCVFLKTLICQILSYGLHPLSY